jgi:parvulin-like peptidyl-prolyl isomerase
MGRRWWSGGVLLLAAALGQAAEGSGRRAADLFPDEVLVQAEGFEIRRSQLDEAVAIYKADAAARGQTLPERSQAEIETNVLDRLTLNQVLLRRATDEDKAKAKEAAEKALAEARRQARSEEGFRRQLLARGLKPDVFEARVLEQATTDKVLEREIKSKLEVTAEQVKDFYEQGLDPLTREAQAAADKLAQTAPDSTAHLEAKRRVEDRKRINQASMARAERVRGSHILLYIIDRVTREDLPQEVRAAKRKEMEKAQARLKAGEDFAKVAREVSEDPDVQETGGEYTWARDASIVPEFKAALFTLPLHQLSDIITSPFAYHVVRLEEYTPAGKPPLAQIEQDIKDFLLNQEVQLRLPAYLEEAKKEFGIRYLRADAGRNK